MLNIRNAMRCPMCGGTCSISNNACTYCDGQNDNLSKAKDELINQIESISFEEVTSENMDYIIFLKEHEQEILQMDKLKDIYINNDINNKFNNMLNNINMKDNADEKLSDIEVQFLSKNIIDNSKFEYKPETIYRKILLHNQVIDKEAFKVVITKDMEKFLINMYPNFKLSKKKAICEITDIKMDDCRGYYDNSNRNIAIANGTIDELYDNANIDGFFTMFHEMYHGMQHLNVENANLNFETMYDTKEFLLFSTLENYYDDNYEYLKTEKDANIFAKLASELFLKNMGLSLTEESKKIYEERYNNELKQRENNVRKYNGEEFDFYDLFDKKIENNPEWLEKYPQLNIEYVLDNGTVRRKTKEEFIDYTMNNNIDDNYFNYLVNRYKQESQTIKM